MPKFQTVSNTQGSSMPSPKSFSQLVALVTTTEAADYLLVCVKDKFNRCSSSEKEKLVQLVDSVEKFVESIHFQRESGTNPWSGVAAIPSDFQNFQHNLVDSVTSIVDKKAVIFDFAVSDESQLIRAYSTSNGDVLEGEAVSAMDIVFNAWLVEKNMINQEGVVYEGDGRGGIKKDKNGADTTAAVEKLKSLITSDKDDGFKKYAQDHGGVQLTTTQRDYAAPAPGQGVSG